MPLVILDRDGVINEDSPDYIKSLAEWHPLPGSIEAIARLSRAGFQVAVATNQSGLGRGLFDLDDLEAMNARLNDLVADQGGELAGIFYCPHTPTDDCQCRKPKPGLLDAIADTLGVTLSGSPVVGDSLRDLEAGVARDCRPILVRSGKGRDSETKLHNNPALLASPPLVFDNLAAVADFLIAELSENGASIT